MQRRELMLAACCAAATGSLCAAPAKPKVLVVWYSKSGNTRAVGRMIAEICGADTFEIVPDRFYGRERPQISLDAKKERETRDLPAIKGTMPDVSNYDLVIVGSPAWWYGLATPVMSFLDKSDFKGAYVAGFNTYGGDGHLFAGELKDQAKNAKFLSTIGFNGTYDTGDGPVPDGEGFQESRRSATMEKLKKWLTDSLPAELKDGLGLTA